MGNQNFVYINSFSLTFNHVEGIFKVYQNKLWGTPFACS